MIFEEGLLAFLLEVPELQSIVNDRIYGMMRPQDGVEQLPAITTQRITTQRQQLFCGVDNLVSADFQLDCYDMGGGAYDLAKAVRKTLENFSGSMGDVVVQQAFLTNEFPANDPDPGVIRVTMLYNFWYLED